MLRVALITSDGREVLKNYAPLTPEFGAPGALLQGFEGMAEVQIHVISCTRKPVKSPEKLAPNIYFHSVVVPKIGWMRTFYQGCIRSTRKKLREIQPDIVHGQGTELDCGMGALFSGYPNVLTIHGNMNAIAAVNHARIGSFLWLAARLETFVLRRTWGVFCNSAYTEKLVAPEAKKTWRMPNALRRKFFDVPTVPPNNSPPVLLNIGVLSQRKRQTEILAMAHKLWKRGVRFELHFAGTVDTGTDYGANFMRQLAAAEAIGYARYIGPLNLDELIAAIDRSSALIHFPSEEAFGLVVAEALARNRKLFASAVGGILDIADGVDGVELFSATAWDDLENGIADWIQKGCPRSAAGMPLMRRRYHPEVVARQHVEIYREILNAK